MKRIMKKKSISFKYVLIQNNNNNKTGSNKIEQVLLLLNYFYTCREF